MLEAANNHIITKIRSVGKMKFCDLAVSHFAVTILLKLMMGVLKGGNPGGRQKAHRFYYVA